MRLEFKLRLAPVRTPRLGSNWPSKTFATVALLLLAVEFDTLLAVAVTEALPLKSTGPTVVVKAAWEIPLTPSKAAVTASWVKVFIVIISLLCLIQK